MRVKLITIFVLAALAFSALPAHTGQAEDATATPGQTAIVQADTPTPTETVLATTEPAPTAAPTNTPTATAVSRPVRPLVSLDLYGVSGDSAIKPGQNFELRFTISNKGNDYAENVTFAFSGTDFLPTGSGGVIVQGEIDPNESINFTQHLTASPALEGQSVATTTITATYAALTDGASYSETFTVTINLNNAQPTYGPAVPTATPTAISRPQLVVSSYNSDVDPLQPGSMFNLEMDVQNLGSADARSVTMVLGGGVTTDSSGTAVPGDISGGNGDLATFAPLGSSNLVYLGNIPLGTKVSTSQKLIVNVTANPGAYAFKVSFVYDDTQGNRLINDQVITLLVYQLPQLDINFYSDPGVFFTGQPGTLPLQVNNLGHNSCVLGNMKVSSPAGQITNDVSLVGALDPGGYFPLDASFIPAQPGPAEIDVTINYTDDFNQAREFTQTLNVDVQEMPTPEPMPEGSTGMYPGDGGMVQPVQETTWDKVVRAFKGLIGLDSAQSTPSLLNGMPSESAPLEGGSEFDRTSRQSCPHPQGLMAELRI